MKKFIIGKYVQFHSIFSIKQLRKYHQLFLEVNLEAKNNNNLSKEQN